MDYGVLNLFYSMEAEFVKLSYSVDAVVIFLL